MKWLDMGIRLRRTSALHCTPFDHSTMHSIYSFHSPVGIDVPLTMPNSPYSYSSEYSSWPTSPIYFNMDDMFDLDDSSFSSLPRGRRLSFGNFMDSPSPSPPPSPPSILFQPAEPRREENRVETYVGWWNRLKALVSVEESGSGPVLADAFLWEFAPVSENIMQASVSWTYEVDPWAEVGTTFPQFRAFLERMGERLRENIAGLRPPDFRFYVVREGGEKVISAVQYFVCD